ncbi:cold-regulated 413 plasma membrane protein 2-like [Lactuca sativa]|uniref:cold-regulated 413 plasma membrane protein 2-like n=1 Tax=Lactuca sativa TaxID=4236 RepID=UPI0022AF9EA3|nr:cold-regulated 413 plasma membrane protein 2-like [Lactuca sativa]
MSTDPTLSEATSKLINSDLKDIGEATRKLADHVIKLGVSGGFITTCLQWIACFAGIYLLILDQTNWRTKILTSLLVLYIFLTLPEWLFGILHGDIGKWITLVGVVLRLFFLINLGFQLKLIEMNFVNLKSNLITIVLKNTEYLELSGSLLLLVVVAPNFVAGYVRVGWIRVIVCLVIGCYLLQEHIRASGGFKNTFNKSNGISNPIGIVLLFVFPVWATIRLIF